ncbi:MAG: hypothetical protein MJ207_03590 [Bacilli bacterium]|nr:hypothetical protein [Bacilli bacterium]
MKIHRLALLSCASIFALISCGSNGKKDFTSIIFKDEEIGYDGKPHTITPTGVPSFAHVTYDDGKEEPPSYTDVNQYSISIKVTADGYNDYLKTATLTIKEGSLYDVIIFEDVTVPYDGQPHTIVAEGIPEGATIKYTPCGDSEDKPPYYTTANKMGYPITLDVDAKGYEHYTRTPKLFIIP